MTKTRLLVATIGFFGVVWSSTPSPAALITDLDSVDNFYTTAISQQYSEDQLVASLNSLVNQAVLEANAASSDSEAQAIREQYILALQTLAEYAQTREDTVDQMMVLLLPQYSSRLAPVPEPSTLLLLGSGLAGSIAFARRRMSK